MPALTTLSSAGSHAETLNAFRPYYVTEVWIRRCEDDEQLAPDTDEVAEHGQRMFFRRLHSDDSDGTSIVGNESSWSG